MLTKWRIKNLDEIDGATIGNFLKSKKPNSPTNDSGATALPPVGDNFMYIEASSNNHYHEKVFASLERIDIIQITIITFSL